MLLLAAAAACVAAAGIALRRRSTDCQTASRYGNSTRLPLQATAAVDDGAYLPVCSWDSFTLVPSLFPLVIRVLLLPPWDGEQ